MERQILNHIVDIEDKTVSLALIEAKQRFVFETSKNNFIKVISDEDNTVVYEEMWYDTYNETMQTLTFRAVFGSVVGMKGVVTKRVDVFSVSIVHE